MDPSVESLVVEGPNKGRIGGIGVTAPNQLHPAHLSPVTATVSVDNSSAATDKSAQTLPKRLRRN